MTQSVTDGMLIALGLLPRAARTPIGPPTVPPVLEVGVVSGRVVNVRLHSSDSTRRGKEVGASGCNLYSYVGPIVPTDPRDWRYEGTSTRVLAQILFPADVPTGSTIWLSARWVSARGAMGPASEPVRLTLQGGSALPVAA
ncbi:MAG TPA: hypothetical protein VK986_25185 [Tepidisphaeraceae bacterium]|nr:hypothetical protein [Tepidisphaeraceae bacterium]